tara:strand:+ start:373 stop:654 length:282 start_codon:yes stop_codon:yes gene_type:complete
MIKYFKERKRLKKFKKDIVGIFDDWEIDGFSLKNKDYYLYVNGFKGFVDSGQSKPFLVTFSLEEKELLWKELKQRGFSNRNKIFKEFNLTNNK